MEEIEEGREVDMRQEDAKEDGMDGSSLRELFNDSTTLVQLSPEISEENATRDVNGEASQTGSGSGSLAPSPSSATPPTIKVTMSFMQAYKIMRGPRDTEPSPLFACLRKRSVSKDGDAGDADDLLRRACRDEVKLLNEVNDEIVRDSDDSDDGSLGEAQRNRSRGGEAPRQDIFFFEAPEVTTLPYDSDDSDDSDLEDGDYCFDHDRLDAGWIQANNNMATDNGSNDSCDSSADEYVSDGEGDPREARVTPAIFRALAAGCTRDDVCRLTSAQSGKIDTGEQGRPRTPLDKILRVSADTSHLNPVRPHCHQRQFDVDTGLELSPAYCVAQGPAPLSAARTPPGVTPQRAGTFLLLLEQNQGQQLYPTRPGPAMPYLFEKMAPGAFRALREQLYGRGDTAAPCCENASSEMPAPAELPWDAVHDAVNGCRFDAKTVSLVPMPRGVARSTGTGTDTSTGQALLQAFHSQWRTITACHAAADRLARANERAQAALALQARRLAVAEHQARALRRREAARERAEAEAHYQKMQRVEQQQMQEQDRKRRTVNAINAELHSLEMAKAEMEARVARGRELQAVLGQRLRDSDARLTRLCQEHGAHDASILSRVLSAKLAAPEER